jgi:radical SAM superfamily enzyme YgiQ (UPF0313 family)
MEIILIQPHNPLALDDRLDLPLGLLSVASVLREFHTVQILDFSGRMEHTIPQADVYGMSLYTPSYLFALKMRDRIREISSAPIIVGGPHASAMPVECAKDFDYVIVGDVETTLPMVIDEIASRKRQEGIVFCDSPRDLSCLPTYDYSLIDIGSYHRKLLGELAPLLTTSRGCPHRCSFCWQSIYQRPYKHRSLEHIAKELGYLRKHANAITFIDDNFLGSTSYLKKLVPLIDRPFSIVCRAEDLSVDICKMLADCGCKKVSCGIESGCQYILDSLHTSKNIKGMMHGLRNAYDEGIFVSIFLIVGSPYETWDTIRESVSNLKSMVFHDYKLYNCTPYPGTKLYNRPYDWNITWLSDCYLDYHQVYGYGDVPLAFEHKNFGRKEVQEWREYIIENLEVR